MDAFCLSSHGINVLSFFLKSFLMLIFFVYSDLFQVVYYVNICTDVLLLNNLWFYNQEGLMF